MKYADDITMVLPLLNGNVDYIRDVIESETNNVRNWRSCNKLTLNTEKSNVMIVSRRPVIFSMSLPIHHVHVLKLLGVLLNGKLTWDHHIDYVRVKASQRLHIIRKLKMLISTDRLHDVYSALIRSLLEYASPVFVGLSRRNNDILRRIDRRAHRIIYSGSAECSKCATSIEDRRVRQAVGLFRQVESDSQHILADLLPRKLPKSGHYDFPCVRTDKYARSFLPFVLRRLFEMT